MKNRRCQRKIARAAHKHHSSTDPNTAATSYWVPLDNSRSPPPCPAARRAELQCDRMTCPDCHVMNGMSTRLHDASTSIGDRCAPTSHARLIAASSAILSAQPPRLPAEICSAERGSIESPSRAACEHAIRPAAFARRRKLLSLMSLPSVRMPASIPTSSAAAASAKADAKCSSWRFSKAVGDNNKADAAFCCSSPGPAPLCSCVSLSRQTCSRVRSAVAVWSAALSLLSAQFESIVTARESLCNAGAPCTQCKPDACLWVHPSIVVLAPGHSDLSACV